MTVRLDQLDERRLAELRARRQMAELASGRPRRRRRPPRQVYPRGLEARYRAFLLQVLADVEAEIEARILPIVERSGDLVRAARPDASGVDVRRVDAPADDVEDAAEEIRERLAGSVLRAGTLERNVEGVGSAVATHNRGQVDRVFQAVIGVGLPAVEPGLNDVLRGFLRENIRRVRNLANEAVDRVAASVLRGFRRGRTNADIARDIQNELGVSRRRARLIARDQIASLNGELTEIRQRSLGVEEYIWRTAGDERVRPAHEALEGTRQRWDDPPAEGHPGEPINCRCIAEPVLGPLFEDLG